MTRDRGEISGRALYTGMGILLALLSVVGIPGSAFPEILHVPDSYSSIQDAVDVSRPGDTVLVESGRHKLYQHILLDRPITLKSVHGAGETIIEGRGDGSVITVAKDCSVIIEGFTITGVHDPEFPVLNGGAIHCAPYSSPTIRDNVITGNVAVFGGGIYCAPYSSPVIVGNVISGNRAEKFGGGIFSSRAYPAISNNRITENKASSGGGGIFSQRGAPIIANNILWKNRAESGGGISCERSSCSVVNNTVTANVGVYGGGIFFHGGSTRVINTISWNNADDLYAVQAGSAFRPNHSNIGGGSFRGINGNLSEDPLFVHPETDDFRLQSGSPCIDAGNPDPVHNDPDGSRNDMGAYGGPKAHLWNDYDE